MDFFESDLEDIIFNASYESLKLRGFDAYFENSYTYRQLNIGNYGIADIVQFKKEYDHISQYRIIPKISIHVIELKKDKIGIHAFLQAIRYCKGIKRFLEHKRKINFDLKFTISLIGKSLDMDSDFVYLPEFFKNEEVSLNLFSYNYTIEGLVFKEEYGFSLVNENFKTNLSFSDFHITESMPF